MKEMKPTDDRIYKQAALRHKRGGWDVTGTGSK